VATTVNVDELPAVIDVGLAARVTVGAGAGAAGETVTAAVDDDLPPVPLALAV
jgi:hypothetical protein